MASVGTAFVSLMPSARGFGAATSKQIGPQVAAAGKSSGSVLSSALKLGAAVGAGAFLKSSVGLEAQFSKTMNQFKASTDLPAAGMKRMQDLALKMGADTVFSASAASDAMLALARSGISPAAIEAGALQSALTLAAAGELEMGVAAETMGNALNTFNLKAKESGAVAAALAGAANASSASVGSIAQGLSQVGTVAADAGFTIQETTGAIAALAQAGIQGSDAGTSLKTMFSNLVPQTDKAFNAMSQYGLVNYDANVAAKELASSGIKAVGTSYEDTYKAVEKYMIQQGMGEKGTAGLAKATEGYLQVTGIMHNSFLKQNGDFKSLGSIAGSLQKQLSGLSDSERATAMNTIFGSDARRAATVLANEGTKGLAKYVKATSDQGAAEKMAAAGMKGTAGAIEAMKGSLENVKLVFGQAVQPLIIFGAHAVSDIANGAVPIIQDLGDKLRGMLKGVDLSGGIKKAMGSIDLAAIFARVRDAIKGIDLSGASDGFSKLGAALANVDWAGLKDALAGGVGDTISVIGVAVGFLAGHLDTLAKYMPLVIGAFLAFQAASALSRVAVLAELPILALHTLALLTNASANRALASQMMITNGVEKVSLLTKLRNTAATVAGTAVSLAAAAASKVMAAGQWLLNAALTANPIGILVVLLAALVVGLVIAWKKSSTFRAIVTGAFLKIREVAGAVLSWLADAVSNVIGFVKDHWKLIVSILGGPLIAVVLLVHKHWGAIKSFIGGAVKAVIGFAVSMGRAIFERVKDVGRFVVGLKDKFGEAVAFVKTIPGRFVDGLGNIGTALLGAGKSLIQGLIDGVTDKFDDLKGTLGKVTGLIPDWKGPPAKDATLLQPAGQLIMGGLIGGIDRKRRDLRSSLRDVTTDIAGVGARLDVTGPGGAPAAHPAGAGVSIRVDKLMPHDYRAFMGDMQRQTQRAALGGFPA